MTDKKILDPILHHHEYLDGSGYPDKLRDKQISAFTQIITVCDMFDAITSERSFHHKKSSFETIQLMKKEFNSRLNSKYMNELVRLFK
ncbi:MAG: hypothetical protein GQ570_09375 [Helicobacteraceae bacterium]|nr:hypothetical protein [Helicobacteraceae bacterium]